MKTWNWNGTANAGNGTCGHDCVDRMPRRSVVRTSGRGFGAHLARGLVGLWAGWMIGSAGAQSFQAGSNQRLGHLRVAANAVVAITLPDDGILDYETIDIGAGAQVTFVPNGNNTPVYLLATGEVTIAGTVSVNARAGTATEGGIGGPGGFDGGMPGFGGLPAGAGRGPGGGLESQDPAPWRAQSAGRGMYSARVAASDGRHGREYGSPLLVPLIGGSGGGGGLSRNAAAGGGGGGGGGAILIGSNTRITLTGAGSVTARGGEYIANSASGSGGAIRLVAPRVIVERRPGGYRLDASGGSYGGDGRIRIDSLLDRGQITMAAITTGVGAAADVALGSLMFTGISTANPRFLLPRLDILHAAGRDIPEGTSAPVTVQLPFNGNRRQTVRVQASGFSTSVFTQPIRFQVAVIPESGTPQFFEGTINVQTGGGRGVVDVGVDIPLNTLCHIQAWYPL